SLPWPCRCAAASSAIPQPTSPLLAGFVMRRFFFQAEDGIRGATVTGVQTCALPILARQQDARAQQGSSIAPAQLVKLLNHLARRSEERRVGKSVDLGGGRSRKEKEEASGTSTAARQEESDGRDGEAATRDGLNGNEG